MSPFRVTHMTAVLASSNASAVLRPFSRAVKKASVKIRAAESSTLVFQQTTVGTPALCAALPRGSEQHPFRTTSSRQPPCDGVASLMIVAKSSGRTSSSPPSGSVKPRVLGSDVSPPGDDASAWPAKSQRRVGRSRRKSSRSEASQRHDREWRPADRRYGQKPSRRRRDQPRYSGRRRLAVGAMVGQMGSLHLQ